MALRAISTVIGVRAVSAQVFQFPALAFDFAALLFDLRRLGILSLRLAFHLIPHQSAAQGAERAADQRAFTRIAVADRTANERASTGAEGATTERAFFACSQWRGATAQQGDKAQCTDQSFHGCLLPSVTLIFDDYLNPSVFGSTGRVVGTVRVGIRRHGILLAVPLRR